MTRVLFNCPRAVSLSLKAWTASSTDSRVRSCRWRTAWPSARVLVAFFTYCGLSLRSFSGTEGRPFQSGTTVSAYAGAGVLGSCEAYGVTYANHGRLSVAALSRKSSVLFLMMLVV